MTILYRITMLVAFPFLCLYDAWDEIKHTPGEIWIRWRMEAHDFKRYWRMSYAKAMAEHERQREEDNAA